MRAAALATNVAAAFFLLLSGCASKGGGPSPGAGNGDDDGEQCSEATPGNKVYITIAIDSIGKPSASPDKCKVLQGANVTLRTDAGVTKQFDIEFKEESAAGPKDPRHLSSSQGNSDRQRIRLTANNATGRSYGYSIIVGDIRVDPTIIIER